MIDSFYFDDTQFNRLFPFFILINCDLKVIAIGKSLSKLIDKEEAKQFNQFFSIPRPHTQINSLDDLKALKDQLVVLHSPLKNNLMLRGQFEYMKEKDEILFIGSPWFASMEQIINNNLAIDDFAIHDPVIDLLHLLKSTEITNEDLKELISTINNQKENLKKINKEVHDIALFPEQNPDPIIRINFQGDLLQNNSAAANLNLIEYKDNTYSNEEFLKLIASKIDKNEQRSVIESRSNNIDYSFVCVPIPEEEYINIYGRNISKQKIVQQELENLSLIVQETINAVIITDAKGKIEWVNKAFEKMTGFNLSESKGKTPGSLLQGKESDQEIVAYMKQQILNEEPFTCEIFNYKKSGEGYWLRINGQPIFDKHGKVIQFFAIEEDITFEKQAQEKIRISANRMSSLITNLHAGILLENDDGSIALINERFCKFFNIQTDPSQMIDSSSTEVIDQSKYFFSNPELFVTRTREIIKNKELVIGDILELVDNRFIQRDYIPIINDGIFEGHLWVFTDITEKITSEKNLEELVYNKQNFLVNMSHEIRTPMNAIIGMIQQLQETPLDKNQHLYMSTISSASENLMVIINQILDLTQLEEGKIVLEKIGFNVKLILRKLIEIMTLEAEGKGLILTNSFCDSRLHPVLLGDPYRFNQILLNLVSNAIKFTDYGNVDIVCNILEESDTVQQIEIKVCDTGIGMDQSFVKNLFEKFQQEDHSITRRFGGTGLGMNISKSLIDLMGGEILVESVKGKGTVMSVKISFHKGTKVDLPKKEKPFSKIKKLNGKKILVVDDNEMNRLVAATVLNQFGVLVTEADNGEKAIKQLKKNTFDLVLMDIKMPGLNGYETTKLIRKELKSVIPILAFTANVVKGEIEKCLEAGMNDYLSKPIEKDQFLKTIHHWLTISEKIVIPVAENINQLPLYDLSKLEEIAKGNQQFINKMVKLFIKEAASSVAQIKIAYQDGDFSKVKAVAHRIKPSIDNMGISSLKNEIREIETHAEIYQSSEQLSTLITNLETTIALVINDLKNYSN